MIKRFKLHETIVEEIKDYIRVNGKKSGDKLPNQQEFTEMFGVSRTALREALRTLQALEIVDIVNGKGVFVKKFQNNNVNKEDNVKNKKKELLDFLEVRASIEGLAVRLAAERISDEEIEELEKNIVIMQEKARRGEPNPVEDKAFHYGIFKAAKNPILLQILKSVYENFEVMWENPLGMGDALTSGIKWHVDIFNYIKNHEPEKAENALKSLIEEIEIITKNI